MPASGDHAPDPSIRPWLLGLVGMAIFALTLPMTRIATGPATAPRLDPVFVSFGRAFIAGILSALYLMAVRAPLPVSRKAVTTLFLAGLGNVIVYPLCLALAVPHVSGAHTAVISGLAPLATSLAAVVITGARGSRRFWLASALGLLLVIGYAAFAEWRESGRVTVSLADLVLVIGIFGAGAAYVKGADISRTMAPEHVISWILVLYLPLNGAVALWRWPTFMPPPAALGALGYVSVFSMWAGFFFWYRGLQQGGALKIGQVQLLQPFVAMFAAIPLLGEPFDPVSLVFCIGIVALVALARRS